MNEKLILNIAGNDARTNNRIEPARDAFEWKKETFPRILPYYIYLYHIHRVL